LPLCRFPDAGRKQDGDSEQQQQHRNPSPKNSISHFPIPSFRTKKDTPINEVFLF